MTRFVPNPAALSKARPPVTMRRLHKFIYVMNTMSKPDEAVAAREAGFGLAELGPVEERFRGGGGTIRVWSAVPCTHGEWLVEHGGVYTLMLRPFFMPDGYASEGKETGR